MERTNFTYSVPTPDSRHCHLQLQRSDLLSLKAQNRETEMDGLLPPGCASWHNKKQVCWAHSAPSVAAMCDMGCVGPATGEDTRCLKIFSNWIETYTEWRSVCKVCPILSLLPPLAGIWGVIGLFERAQEPNILRHFQVQMLLGIKLGLSYQSCNFGLLVKFC